MFISMFKAVLLTGFMYMGLSEHKVPLHPLVNPQKSLQRESFSGDAGVIFLLNRDEYLTIILDH